MPGTTTSFDSLVTEISTRREAIEHRIEAACTRVGRDRNDVRLIAITKGFPVETVRAAVAAGLTDLGENRVQELDEKAGKVAGKLGGGDVRWHLVGSLQRNKAKRSVEITDVFHALDSPRLARELDKRAAFAERVMPCYVQVNVSGEATKYGLDPDDVHSFLDSLAEFDHLRIVGLMTLAAPVDADSELETVVRPQLRSLAMIATTYKPRDNPVVSAPLRLSMGMSGDFEVAIEEGATDVRIGTSLFGSR